MVSNPILLLFTKIKELLLDKINNLSGWMNLRLDHWEINHVSFLAVWALWYLINRLFIIILFTV